MYILYLITFFPIIRFILNISYYFRLKKLYSKYIVYLTSDNNLEFIEYTQEIKELFNGSGLEDSTVPHQELLGYGQIVNHRVSVFQNLHSKRNDVSRIVTKKFYESIGVYKRKTIESLNPLFWLEFIIKLPNHIYKFLGILPENQISKIFTLIYWLVVLPILTILFGINLI